jgi:mannose-6-phosphate isomerase-like protein (cupin superfamily)
MITLHLKEQGETLTFFTEPDPSAPAIDFECSMAPGRPGPDPHIHPLQTETFQVTRGRMLAVVQGEQRLLGEGETIVVAPGQAHTFSNPDPTEPLTMRIRIEPALNFQWFMTEAARSAIRNGGSWKDMPLLEAGYILDQVRDEYDFPRLPPIAKRLFFGTLARAAVVLGKTREIAPLAAPKVSRLT